MAETSPNNPVPPSDGIVPYAATEADVDAVLSELDQKLTELGRDLAGPDAASLPVVTAPGAVRETEMPPIDRQIDEVESLLHSAGGQLGVTSITSNHAPAILPEAPPANPATPPAHTEAVEPLTRAASSRSQEPSSAGATESSSQSDQTDSGRRTLIDLMLMPVALIVSLFEIFDWPFRRIGYRTRVMIGYAALATLVAAGTLWAISLLR